MSYGLFGGGQSTLNSLCSYIIHHAKLFIVALKTDQPPIITRRKTGILDRFRVTVKI